MQTVVIIAQRHYMNSLSLSYQFDVDEVGIAGAGDGHQCRVALYRREAEQQSIKLGVGSPSCRERVGQQTTLSAERVRHTVYTWTPCHLE